MPRIVHENPEVQVLVRIQQQVTGHATPEVQAVPRIQNQVIVHVIPEVQAEECAPRVGVPQVVPQFAELKRLNFLDGTVPHTAVYTTECGVWEELETGFRVEVVETPVNEHTGKVDEVVLCPQRSQVSAVKTENGKSGDWATPCCSHTISGARCVVCCNRR